LAEDDGSRCSTAVRDGSPGSGRIVRINRRVHRTGTYPTLADNPPEPAIFGDGDPVRTLILKRGPSGKALLTVGTQSLDVVPPNTGDEGGVILTINNGGTYCALFGGAAGGVESDGPQEWKVLDATLVPLPMLRRKRARGTEARVGTRRCARVRTRGSAPAPTSSRTLTPG
jgi:hypothetical protein